MIPSALAGQSAGPVATGGLDDDHLADGLALGVGLVDEQVGEGAQEPPGAELEDGFG